MSKTTRKKISELKFDQRNINKGSEFGNSLLEKSLREVGAGRSVLLDKNLNIIAGNQTIQKASELGFEDVVIVQTTGNQVVAVQRMDIDINSEMGTKLKILDNTVSKVNYVEDVEIAEVLCEEYKLQAANYGMKFLKAADEQQHEPSGYDQEKQWYINIRCDNEEQTQKLYERFIAEGLDVKIVT